MPIDAGDIRVEMRVDDSGAQRDLDRAFGKIGQKIEENTAGVRKFAGAISSTIGIVTSLLGVFTAIGGVFAVLLARSRALNEQQRRYNELANQSYQTAETMARTITLQAEVARGNVDTLSESIEKERIRAASQVEQLERATKLNELENERAKLRGVDTAAAERQVQQLDAQIERIEELKRLITETSQINVSQLTDEFVRAFQERQRLEDEEKRARAEARAEEEAAAAERIAEAEDRHRDWLSKLREQHEAALQLDRERHEERLRQIQREAEALRTSQTSAAFGLGIASGASGSLSETIAGAYRPGLHYRTKKGGG